MRARIMWIALGNLGLILLMGITRSVAAPEPTDTADMADTADTADSVDPAEPTLIGDEAADPGVSRPSPAFTDPALVLPRVTNFVNTLDGCRWASQYGYCRVNWSGSFFASRTPTTSGRCIVDHFHGDGVTVRITSGTTITTSFHGPGTYTTYYLGTPGAGTTRRIDIMNATGDRYNVGCSWGN